MLFSITLLLSSLTATSWAALQVPITVARSTTNPGLSARAVNAPLTNINQGSRYLLNGSLGTPPQGPISWFIDTGSRQMISFAYNSTTCVAPYDANAPKGCLYGTFNPSESSTYVITGAGQLNSQYGYSGGYGFDPGDLFTDTVTIAGTAITDVAQGITYGQNSSVVENDPFGNGLGIMGLAGGPDDNYPSILGRLLAQGTINRAAFSIWENARNANDGEIVFGGVDQSKYTGSLIATSFSGDTNYPLSVSMTGFSLVDAAGASHSLFPTGFGGSSMLIDTGNPDFFALPPPVLSLFLTALGASNETGSLVVPCDLSASTASLSFAFGGAGGPVINIPVSALVADESPIADTFFNTDGSSIPACNLFGIGAMDSTNSGNLGTLWQEWAYMVFDEQDGLIALAQSAQNTAAESIQDFADVNSIPGAVATVTYTIANPGATGAEVSVLTTATSTVKGTVTGYPCVTPEYNLGVSVCQASTASSTSSSTSSSRSTSSTAPSSSSTTSKTSSSSSTSNRSTSSSSSTGGSSSKSLYSNSTWSTSSTASTSSSLISSSGTLSIPSSTGSKSSSTSSGRASSYIKNAISTDGDNHGGWPVDPTSIGSSASASSTSLPSGTWAVDPKSTSSFSSSGSSPNTSWGPWSADPSSGSTSSSSWPVDPAGTSSSSSSKKMSSSSSSMTWGAWSVDPGKTSSYTSTSSTSTSMTWGAWSADPSKTSSTSTSTSSSTTWAPWSSPSSVASSTLSASTKTTASSTTSGVTPSTSAATPYGPASASSSGIAGWGSNNGPTTTASSSPVSPATYGSASGIAPFLGVAHKAYASGAMMLGAAVLFAAAMLI